MRMTGYNGKSFDASWLKMEINGNYMILLIQGNHGGRNTDM